MAQALPLTKLAGLLVKTLAKPLSKRIKHEFSRYGPTKRFLITIGRVNNQITSRMTIWSAGYRVRSIKPLDENQALANGADFFGEALIFSVSGGVVVWEYNRSKQSSRKAAAEKAARIRDEQAQLTAKLRALDVRLKAVETVVKRNSDSILQIGARYVEPPTSELVPIVDEQDDVEALRSVQSMPHKPAPIDTSALSGDDDNASPAPASDPTGNDERNRKSGWRSLWPF